MPRRLRWVVHMRGNFSRIQNEWYVDSNRTYAVVLEPDEDEGGYTAIVPALPGVVTEGDTIDEALANARDAIQLCLEDLAERGDEIPSSDTGARLERVEVPIAS